MIERFERFSCVISDISKYWHKIASDEMEKYGLKGSHAIYLTTLHRYPEGVTAVNLCEICGKDKADVSRMMNIMSDKGLIIKEGSSSGQYRAKLKLTEEGKNAAEQVAKRAALAVDLAGGEITENDRAVFYNVLEHIAKNLRMISEEGLPVE